MILPLCLALLAQPGTDAPPAFPRTPPTEPAAAAATFRVRDGFRMDLLAAEPLVMDPVAAAYDEDGRLFVVEMSDYPHVKAENDKPFAENTLDPPVGRLKRLVDRDGDGTFDEASILADKLSWPTGVAIWKGGAFVAATPSIWYIKDADGDGRAEIREEVYRGFRKYNVQAVMNNLQWGLDHAIYGAGSSNGGDVRPADDPAAAAVTVLRRDFRFSPGSRSFEAISGGARFGNTFDDWGNRFLCDIRNPAEHVVLPARYLARNPKLAVPKALHDIAPAGDSIPMFRISPPEPWRDFRARRWAGRGKVMPRSELVGAGFLTSASGLTAYRGDAYPPAYRGQLLLGEVANNLVHRMAVEPDGVTFRAHRADDGAEFVASTDTWFRPVNFVNAPDGTLHVLDMYRETIEHPWSIPDDIKAALDLRSGEDRGRIYRLAPPGFAHRPTPKLSEATTAALVALLEHPNAWHRDTAHRLLFERQDRGAIAPLRALLRDSKEPLGRLHALRSLDGLGGLDDADLLVALNDPDPGVREHAVALAEPRLAKSAPLRGKVVALAADPAARVRFQVAFSLGEIANSGPDAVPALATIAARDAGDAWIRTAVLSSASEVAAPLFFAITAGDRAGLPPDAVLVLKSLAGQVGAAGDLGAASGLLGRLRDGFTAEAREEILLGLGEGLGRVGRVSVLAAAARDPDAAGLVRSTLADAAGAARDDQAPPARRERAIALLALDDFGRARDALGPLLVPGQPQAIQVAAARALAKFPDAEVAPLLIGRWPGLSPATRAEVIARLLSRPAWASALLAAVESGAVPASVIPAANRTRLLADRDPKTQALARALFGGASPGPRGEAFAKYRPALDLPADRARGEKVFDRECIACHKLGQRGNAVGPNLASIRRRAPDEVLLHIVDPNREVAPDYMDYAVTLSDGRTVGGLIAGETAASLTLVGAGGVPETVLRSEVEGIVGTGKSLMPEGLEGRIAPQEMADLISFLLGLQE
ncbi:PVC-type heme-binding CxxCH protein [Tundrisphaera sp. TA3]|uniref:PVC-type heme-binding CxxCH protein n=1 Tax=Tundrisphaera sp. TA3 TaxID=3435775 RepID=UPI003EBFFAE5